MAIVTTAEYDYRFKVDLDPDGQDDRLPDIENGLNEAQAIVADYLKSGWDRCINRDSKTSNEQR